jgi:hypothetical protein
MEIKNTLYPREENEGAKLFEEISAKRLKVLTKRHYGHD